MRGLARRSAGMQEQDRLLSIAWEQFRPDVNGLVNNSALLAAFVINTSSAYCNKPCQDL